MVYNEFESSDPGKPADEHQLKPWGSGSRKKLVLLSPWLDDLPSMSDVIRVLHASIRVIPRCLDSGNA